MPLPIRRGGEWTSGPGSPPIYSGLGRDRGVELLDGLLFHWVGQEGLMSSRRSNNSSKLSSSSSADGISKTCTEVCACSLSAMFMMANMA